MPGYYNEILIIGPGIQIDSRLLKLYQNPPRIIVGDGINSISLKELKTIKKLIGPDTRIDIIGHGNVDSSGTHTIELIANTTIAADTVKQIGKLTKYAKHMHLWSCFGGAANDAVSTLPSGSVLITHSPDDDYIYLETSFDSIVKSLQKREKRRKANVCLTPIQEYCADFECNVLQTASINKKESNTIIRHTTRNADIFFTGIPEQRKYFELEVQAISEKFKEEVSLSLPDSDLQEYMQELIFVEVVKKRGLKKLINTSRSNQAAFHEMLIKWHSGIFTLLEFASVHASLQIFKVIDVKKDMPLDGPLFYAIYSGNKDVASYIITNNRFNLQKLNDGIVSYGKKELMDKYFPDAEKTQDYWKVAALIECGVKLKNKLEKLSDIQKTEIIKSAVKNNFVNAYITVLKSLLEHGQAIPKATLKYVTDKPDVFLDKIIRKFNQDLQDAEKTQDYWKVAALIECGIKLENKLEKLSDIQKVEIIKSAVKNNFVNAYINVLKPLLEHGQAIPKTALKYVTKKSDGFLDKIIKKFNQDLNEAKNATKINQTIKTYQGFERKLNINLKVDFEAIKQQKLSERSIIQKIIDSGSESISILVKYVKNIDFNKYITRLKNFLSDKVKNHRKVTKPQPFRAVQQATKIKQPRLHSRNKASYMDRITRSRANGEACRHMF
jgi:acetolactate synthase regulatory subunit